MGDPKKSRKKFSKPTHPWNKDRIAEEKKISKDYGLRRKDEIWKMSSRLKRYFGQAKQFIASTTPQSAIESQALLRKLTSMGVLPQEARIEDVLGVQLKDIMDRRLQTILVKKELAGTMNQARQFIVHEHVSVAGKKITSPSYLVSVEEEPLVVFSGDSALAKEDHPERAAAKKEKKTAKKEEKSDDKKAEETEKKADAKEQSPSKEAETKKEVKADKEEKKAETTEDAAKEAPAEKLAKEEAKPEAKE